jgi:hypothetical protein
MVWFGTKGLATGIISGKAIFNFSDSPLPFIAPFIPTILFNPSIVKCSFRFINSNPCLNN